MKVHFWKKINQEKLSKIPFQVIFLSLEFFLLILFQILASNQPFFSLHFTRCIKRFNDAIICPCTVELKSLNFERTFFQHHVSHSMRPVSPVTCHLSHITFKIKCCFSSLFNKIKKIIIIKKIQSCGASRRWRVCYQRGLPCIVFSNEGLYFKNPIHTSLRYARSEYQSVLESSGDRESESKRFQFSRGTLTKLSQSQSQLSPNCDCDMQVRY